MNRYLYSDIPDDALAILSGLGICGAQGAPSFIGFGTSIDAQNYYQPERVPTALPLLDRQPSTTYVVGNVRKSGGNAYRCSTAGTSSASTAPLSGTTPTDGTVVWSILYTQAIKRPTAWQTWVELFSNGRVRHSLEDGYKGTISGLLKVEIINGGSGYVNPTYISPVGAAISLDVSGGVIIAAHVTDPGYGVNAPVLSDAGGGTGAVLGPIFGGTGSFGSGGDTTEGMLARIDDVLASPVPIIVVGGDINSVSLGYTAAQIIPVKAEIYRRLVAGGKIVIAETTDPKAGLAASQAATIALLNQFTRAFCAGETWANNTDLRRIVCADGAPYWQNMTSAVYAPVGGVTGASGSVVIPDGTHPSALGGFGKARPIWEAMQQFVGPALAAPTVKAPVSGGYHKTDNPRGNLLDPRPWTSLTAVSLGDTCTAGGGVWTCLVAGTTGSSGGPTGTTNFSGDGTVTWSYRRPSGISVGNVDLGGAATAATGIVYTGTPPLGTTIGRTSGSAAGTVTITKASRTGGRQGTAPQFAFSLGSGTALETWKWTINTGIYRLHGIRQADVDAGRKVGVKIGLELANIANMESVGLSLQISGSTAMFVWVGVSGADPNNVLPLDADWPTKNLFLPIDPVQLPADFVTGGGVMELAVLASFDASGGAGSATATIKVTYLEMTLIA